MDRRSVLAGVLALCAPSAFAASLDDILGAVKSSQSAGPKSSGGLPAGVSGSEGIGGLKEALTNGAVAAVLRVSKLDGYWGDNKIRIPLPSALASVQSALKPMGASGALDDLQLRINHAAEKAAPKARTLFTNAIRGMTVDDVAGVLRGGDTAGTSYLRDKTGSGLTTLFHPPIKSALHDTGAVTAFNKAVTEHGAGGLLGSRPENALTDFAVAKGLDGIFYYVGEEERAIRANPLKQSSALLRKVFGNL